jgi:dipeptidyl aminopeptidase/acylaminoacyl peptidase
MKCLIAVAAVLLLCVGLAVASELSPATPEAIPHIDISPSGDAAQSPHPITLDEIVSFREVKEPRRSPDGSKLAFLLTQAFRSCDCYRTALYIVGTSHGSVPRKLVEETTLSSIRWTPDGNGITFLSSTSGSQQLWRVDPDSRFAEQVFTHVPGEDQTINRIGYHPSDTSPVGVFTYEWSPDGKQITFTTSPSIDKSELDRLNKQGILFDEKMDSFTLLTQQWLRVPTQLWIYDLEKKTEEQIWENHGEISSIEWSPDSRRIALAYSAPPKLKNSMVYFNQDVGFVEPETKAFTAVASGEAAETMPHWSPNGQYLAYSSWLGYDTSPLVLFDLASGKTREVVQGANAREYWWADDSRELIYQSGLRGKRRERMGLFRATLDGQPPRRITPESDHLEDCDSVRKNEAICVWQSSNVPPNPALVDLATAKIRPLADINPQMQNITVGHVTEMRWNNKFGAETTGYLLKPFDYVSGKRYPLLIILYGFEGKFVTQAEWLSSYPAQVFARDGFVVLMTNYPPYDDWKGKDFARGSVAEGYSPLASIESAVNRLAKDGIADGRRVGIMGISYGGFLTEFSITHSQLFQAASLVDGGGYGPAAYALSGHNGHENDERVLGGPPYGKTLQNWMNFSPPMNAHRVVGPMLMGFNNHEAFYGMEMRSALDRAGVPVEFWVYPGEGHIFTGPEHRFVSMERNLDWFNFWLQDKEDPAAGKHDQYVRWRGMQKQLAARAQKLRAAKVQAANLQAKPENAAAHNIPR